MNVLNELRKAVEKSGQTRYRIGQEAGIAQSQLSRMVRGKAGMSLATVERLADYLGLELVLRPKQSRAGRKGG